MAYPINPSTRLTQQPRQEQKLILTPQLQQAIKLLQLSRLDLIDAITAEMEVNPILEEYPDEDGSDNQAEEATEKQGANDGIDWENYLSQTYIGGTGLPYEGREAPSYENFIAAETNLADHLHWQLEMSDLTETQREIGVHIIGNLDDDGYLKASTEELAAAMACSERKIFEVLRVIQNFNPIGVAAQDLRECLLISDHRVWKARQWSKFYSTIWKSSKAGNTNRYPAPCLSQCRKS